MISYYLKLIGQFYQDMRHQKLRTFLTVFGITWGTIAVVLLLAFGVGLEAYSMRAMHGMGTNIVIFGGQRTSLSHMGMNKGRQISLREPDISLLRNNVPQIEMISPENNRWGNRIVHGREARSVNLSGVYPDFGRLRNMIPEPGGRFINQPDIDSRRRVVFLGNELRNKLFGTGSNPVGRTVLINKSPFTVVGVLQHKIQNNSYGGRDSEMAYIPFSTYSSMYGDRPLNRIICRAADATDTEEMIEAIRSTLGRRHRFDPEDKEALWLWDTAEGEKFVKYFFLGFRIFLGGGGFLTLLVGGIGVANIMYIVVRERRREIGVKMALGCRPRLIMMQFMIETFMIVGMGGALGFATSWSVVRLFQTPMLTGTAKYIGVPTINPLVAAVTISVIGLIGVAAGMAPARRAANMDPVRALEF